MSDLKPLLNTVASETSTDLQPKPTSETLESDLYASIHLSEKDNHYWKAQLVGLPNGRIEYFTFEGNLYVLRVSISERQKYLHHPNKRVGEYVNRAHTLHVEISAFNPNPSGFDDIARTKEDRALFVLSLEANNFGGPFVPTLNYRQDLIVKKEGENPEDLIREKLQNLLSAAKSSVELPISISEVQGLNVEA